MQVFEQATGFVLELALAELAFGQATGFELELALAVLVFGQATGFVLVSALAVLVFGQVQLSVQGAEPLQAFGARSVLLDFSPAFLQQNLPHERLEVVQRRPRVWQQELV